MTGPMPFELTDEQIERMLVRRGGTGAPRSLASDLIASVVETPQDRGWLGPVLPRISPNARTLLVAAAITLALITGALLVGGPFRAVVPPPLPSASAEPSVSVAPSAPPSATPTPTPTPLPTPDPLPAIPISDHGPLIVYEYGKSAINLFTLDAFTSERVSMGQMQRGAAVAGQSIHWSNDRQSAFVFQGSDSVSAMIDVTDRSVSSLAGIGPSGSRDAVSPAGNQIARLTDENDIEILDLNGDPAKTLALPDGIQPLIRIVWSPDASLIAVSSCLPCEDKGVPASWHVFVAPVDGSPVRQVGDLVTDYIGIDDWSPDKSRLLIGNAVRDEPPTGGVGVMDLRTGATTQLTTGAEEGSSFSPDGAHIVFADSFGGTHLNVMSADGSANSRRVLVTTKAGTGVGDPIWSPNGDWILYRVIPITDGSQTGIGDLWMVPSSGGEPRLVLKSAIADW